MSRYDWTDARTGDTITPSPQQEDYFSWLVTGRGSLVLEAVAGAGKTTTLIQGLPYMNGTIAMVAFNKKIAAEMKRKADEQGYLRPGLKISTMHSLGYSAWMRMHKEVVVNENKLRDIIELQGDAAVIPGVDLVPFQEFIIKMINYGRQALIGVKYRLDDVAKWAEIEERYGTKELLPDDGANDPVTYRAAMNKMVRVFKRSIDTCFSVIDYEDMIFAPLCHGARFFTNDWVIVDEAQDTNDSKREMLRRMMHPRSRLVAVGDSRQAIYQFTGASSDALDLIEQQFNTSRLPLTVSYRCPRAVVAHAHQWVSHIQAAPSAIEGTVRGPTSAPDYGGLSAQDRKQLASMPWFMHDRPEKTDAILCRYNAPLITTAYAMLKANIACRVEGRDIGRGLIALCNRWKVKTLDALQKKLEAHLEKELAKAKEKRSETMAQSAQDRHDCLMIFIERCRANGKHSVACVVASIEELFADDVTGVTVLSSIHKAKGREWPRVYWLLQPPNGRELKDWEVVAEDNLCYVATTRAQDTLVLVPPQPKVIK